MKPLPTFALSSVIMLCTSSTFFCTIPANSWHAACHSRLMSTWLYTADDGGALSSSSPWPLRFDDPLPLVSKASSSSLLKVLPPPLPPFPPLRNASWLSEGAGKRTARAMVFSMTKKPTSVSTRPGNATAKSTMAISGVDKDDEAEDEEAEEGEDEERSLRRFRSMRCA